MRDLPWRMISLVVGLLFLAMLLYRSLASSAPDAPGPTAVTPEVHAPPADIHRDPHAAAGYVEAETCRAACAAADRTCRGMAAEDPDRLAACAVATAECTQRCR